MSEEKLRDIIKEKIFKAISEYYDEKEKVDDIYLNQKEEPQFEEYEECIKKVLRKYREKMLKKIFEWHKEQVKDECRKLVPNCSSIEDEFHRGFNFCIGRIYDNINNV